MKEKKSNGALVFKKREKRSRYYIESNRGKEFVD